MSFFRLTVLLCTASIPYFSFAQEGPTASVPWIGVYVKSVPESVRAQVSLPGNAGLIVERVSPGSPADIAKITVYDIIYGFNEQILFNDDQLYALLANSSIGERPTLKVLRRGQPLEVTVTLSERPANQPRREWFNVDFDIDFESLREELENNKELQQLVQSAGEETQRLIEELRREMPSENEMREIVNSIQESIQENSGVWAERYQRILRNARTEEEEARDSVEVIRRSRVDSDQREIRYNDRDGQLEITISGENLDLRVKSRAGNTVFDGPLTLKTFERLPEEHQERVQRLLKIHNLDL